MPLSSPIDNLPGFRRRFRVTPEAERICCEVEDDFHCMSVVIHHDGETASHIEPLMRRAPWTTCPGAEQVLEETFSGARLAEFHSLGGKKANCTHLYDLALLAAHHANDRKTTIYDILISDPVEGQRRAEIYQSGELLLTWTESNFDIVEPEAMQGLTLLTLQDWLLTLDSVHQNAARLLRWANMVANGRTIPMENQSDATKMPANCYTFQPQRAVKAVRVGEVRDFSTEATEPLAEYQAFL